MSRDDFRGATPLARIDAAQLTTVEGEVALVSDDDLPERDRRTRSETLTLRGVEQTRGDPILYDTAEVTFVGRGRGVDWWLIAWTDVAGDLFYGTAHESRLTRPA